ncbi:hypothetical protein SAMN04487820_111173 [Actinopolyspora mzabensis]|uniref:Uncharacterized protein n=1 Tax=Actinopolyspora mzabensis TaxID=995066 RepID=A0A1G9E7S1_ACTMZ|nr:hypothetical protein [Actinopolyspora mzabensis]SDK72182.1 hypothetical protein SAMN04487820_111173 [Actinopolyspora mzabensis]
MRAGSNEGTTSNETKSTLRTGGVTTPKELLNSAQRPQVFALLERTDPESGELDLYAWGVEVGGSANVFRSDGHVLAHCGSAEGARRMFGIIRDVVLVRPDETGHPA